MQKSNTIFNSLLANSGFDIKGINFYNIYFEHWEGCHKLLLTFNNPTSYREI